MKYQDVNKTYENAYFSSHFNLINSSEPALLLSTL